MYGGDEATGTEFDAQLAAFDTIHANGGKTFNAIPDATTALRAGMNQIDGSILYGYGMQSSTIAQVHLTNTNSKVFMYGDPFADFENPQRVRNHYGFSLLYKGYDGVMNYAYQAKEGAGDI